MLASSSLHRSHSARLRLAAWCCCLLAGLALLVGQPPRAQEATARILQIDLAGGVSPAVAEMVANGVERAEREDYDMVLLRIDTPGGLVTSMRDIIKTILNSEVPVAAWVAPSGAHAASAGMFIVAACPVAAMAPQTSIGSATPITLQGEDVQQAQERKVVNDLLSLVRGVGQRYGRNVEWYARAIEEAVSATATEAVQLGAVDFVASDVGDLLTQVQARGLRWQGEAVTVDPQGAVVDTYEPGLRYQLLGWLVDPQIAYFLLMGGLAGLFFELSSPGAIFPGAIGAICLLLAFYALSVLPVTASGILLILLGCVLFVLEVGITSYGLLALGGLVSLFVGSMLLYDESAGMPGLPLTTIGVTVGGVGLLIGAAVWLTLSAHRRQPMGGLDGIIGQTGTVRNWHAGEGTIFVRGELWNARTDEATELSSGEKVRVVRATGLTLDVVPWED